MIVVTGLGRSGTSFVASLYRELGFDPGGWSPLDHVLVCVRDLRTAVRSRVRARFSPGGIEGPLTNRQAYGLGLCMAALVDHRLPHSVMRFPDFLREPDTLFRAMRFPRKVDRASFLDAFERLARPELVHEWR